MEGETSWWTEHGGLIMTSGVGLLVAVFIAAMARLPFVLFGNKMEDD